MVFFERDDLDHLVPILVAIAVGAVVGVVGAQRVQMTQMPQLVALFNGVGGGAAALVALLELHEFAELADAGFEPPAFDLAATAFTILVGAVSFSGSLVTFAKLQELMTTRPVLFPGLPFAFAGSLLAGIALSVRDGRRAGLVARRRWWACSVSCSACCWCCPSAAPTCRS